MFKSLLTVALFISMSFSASLNLNLSDSFQSADNWDINMSQDGTYYTMLPIDVEFSQLQDTISGDQYLYVYRWYQSYSIFESDFGVASLVIIKVLPNSIEYYVRNPSTSSYVNVGSTYSQLQSYLTTNISPLITDPSKRTIFESSYIPSLDKINKNKLYLIKPKETGLDISIALSGTHEASSSGRLNLNLSDGFDSGENWDINMSQDGTYYTMLPVDINYSQLQSILTGSQYLYVYRWYQNYSIFNADFGVPSLVIVKVSPNTIEYYVRNTTTGIYENVGTTFSELESYLTNSVAPQIADSTKRAIFESSYIPSLNKINKNKLYLIKPKETGLDISIDLGVQESTNDSNDTIQSPPATPSVISVPQFPDLGYYDGILHYDGQTASRVSITLPTGTYNVYAEDTGTNDNYIYNIDTSITYQNGDVNTSVSVLSTNAGVQFINNTGSDQNYTIYFDTKFQENPIETNMWIGIVSKDAPYPTRGSFVFGDVTSNSGAILSMDETHEWTTSTLVSSDAGLYTLSVTTDNNSSRNPLESFFVEIVQMGNNQIVYGQGGSAGTSTGELSATNITLESGAQYIVRIKTVGLTTVRSDYLGYYTIKLIKQ